MDKDAFECGKGWHGLIEPLLKLCTELGGTVTQVKEKFGGLRFYYYQGDPGTEHQWDEFEERVDQAQDQSQHTCELCGMTGRTLSKGGWLKTLCATHAQELGYKA